MYQFTTQSLSAPKKDYEPLLAIRLRLLCQRCVHNKSIPRQEIEDLKKLSNNSNINISKPDVVPSTSIALCCGLRGRTGNFWVIYAGAS